MHLFPPLRGGWQRRQALTGGVERFPSKAQTPRVAAPGTLQRLTPSASFVGTPLRGRKRIPKNTSACPLSGGSGLERGRAFFEETGEPCLVEDRDTEVNCLGHLRAW
jgi:hypothetical protein